MYLAPLNYDRFFKKVFSEPSIAQRFLEDFLSVEIQEFEVFSGLNRVTDDAALVEFDYRCKIDNTYVIVDMQQWYKPDIGQRFYLYHALNSGLQLESLPKKRLVLDKHTKTLKPVKDYRRLDPVITLVWMADDRLGFSENYVSYTMLPEALSYFLRDGRLWGNAEISELMKRRSSLLELMSNDSKGIGFLALNRLIFVLQPNILESDEVRKYVRWFKFAGKTMNSKNREEDFEEFRGDVVFEEMIRRLDSRSLTREDERYLEDERSIWEEMKRYEEGILEEGRKEGREEERAKNRIAMLSLARALINSGMDVEKVSSMTGLSPEEIWRER